MTSLRIAGIPFIALIAAAFVAIGYVVLYRTATGRELFAVGSNPDGARLIGIPADRRIVAAFAMAGLLGGLCGALWASRYATVDARVALGFELTVIASAVVGGVAIRGGSGRLLGIVLGAFTRLIIKNGLTLVRVDPLWLQGVYRLVILVTVGALTLLITPDARSGKVGPNRLELLKSYVAAGGEHALKAHVTTGPHWLPPGFLQWRCYGTLMANIVTWVCHKDRRSWRPGTMASPAPKPVRTPPDLWCNHSAAADVMLTAWRGLRADGTTTAPADSHTCRNPISSKKSQRNLRRFRCGVLQNSGATTGWHGSSLKHHPALARDVDGWKQSQPDTGDVPGPVDAFSQPHLYGPSRTIQLIL